MAYKPGEYAAHLNLKFILSEGTETQYGTP